MDFIFFKGFFNTDILLEFQRHLNSKIVESVFGEELNSFVTSNYFLTPLSTSFII